MTDDNLTPILVDGREVARVRLAPATHENRRTINLGLGIVQLPGLLADFRPERAMAPQERFLVLVRAFCEAMNDGRRNQLDENELAKLYMQTHGVGSALSHQVRRASGDMICTPLRRPCLGLPRDRVRRRPLVRPRFLDLDPLHHV